MRTGQRIVRLVRVNRCRRVRHERVLVVVERLLSRAPYTCWTATAAPPLASASASATSVTLGTAMPRWQVAQRSAHLRGRLAGDLRHLPVISRDIRIMRRATSLLRIRVGGEVPLRRTCQQWQYCSRPDDAQLPHEALHRRNEFRARDIFRVDLVGSCSGGGCRPPRPRAPATTRCRGSQRRHDETEPSKTGELGVFMNSPSRCCYLPLMMRASSGMSFGFRRHGQALDVRPHVYQLGVGQQLGRIRRHLGPGRVARCRP